MEKFYYGAEVQKRIDQLSSRATKKERDLEKNKDVQEKPIVGEQ